MPHEQITLVQIEFDSGTRYYSFEGIASDRFYAPKLRSVDSIVRQTSWANQVGFRISGTVLRFNNADEEFSTLKATTPFRNRTVKILFGDSDLDISEFTNVFTGKISDWNFASKGIAELRVNDAIFDTIKRKLGGFIDAKETGFENRPADDDTRLKTIIYGNVSSIGFSGTGDVPCYLIDPAIGGSTFKYFVARHICKEITNVYKYGVLLSPSAYTITDDGTNQFIEITADPQDEARPDEFEITADVKGVTDTGLASGTLIDNPIKQIEHYLLNFVGVVAGDIDSASITKASNAATSLGYTSAFAIVKENITHEVVINRFAESFEIRFFVGRGGKFTTTLFFITDIVDPTVLQDVTDDSDIIRAKFKVEGPKEVASRLQHNFGYNWAKNFFSQQPDRISTVEQANLGADLRSNANLWYVRNSAIATNVAIQRLFELREDQQIAIFEVPIKFFNLELNDYVQLTHFSGPSPDGEGYKKVAFLLVSLRIFFNGRQMRVVVRGVRLSSKDTSSGGFWKRFIKFGDENEISDNWNTATDFDRDYFYMADETILTGSPEGTLGAGDPAKLWF